MDVKLASCMILNSQIRIMLQIKLILNKQAKKRQHLFTSQSRTQPHSFYGNLYFMVKSVEPAQTQVLFTYRPCGNALSQHPPLHSCEGLAMAQLQEKGGGYQSCSHTLAGRSKHMPARTDADARPRRTAQLGWCADQECSETVTCFRRQAYFPADVQLSVRDDS